mmetsp:Transcript_14067/g.25421  ORF Transcript_14067/g.25421 Transcript_14067/m.25421 type:complete len:259 (-) Transcript_14067:1830-2606(-)|eukprot:CAMPEP_0198287488 /NCGR_PEP_ID=MMETSP1449-20131203/6280_1 /TAXON_ID=420275 /ORGANISM="Attheya septentrionalis, Strain CCMP2084" /LENGTH=258 /DNA_ID=CAMNT_0043985447 /DNA_START=128 /DNA_END=904 /DNA_ORIENTATION=+
MGRRSKIVEEPAAVDPTGWMIDGSIPEFLLMHTYEIKYMCMLAYTFYAGMKVFKAAPADASTSYKFINMILACTGGGILVPIFINSIPVPLSTDAYPIAIFISFMIHQHFPILRDVFKKSPIVKVFIIVMYEIMRAGVVVTLTKAAAVAIPASNFSFPVFGPIFCGSIGGCGGAFLPLSKGLDPIKNGLAPNMLSACIGATLYHIFTSTSLSDGVIDAGKKAHIHVVLFFILVGLSSAFDLLAPPAKSPATTAQKKEN